MFPPGWETGERRNELLHRRAFFEITLHSWITRHDVDGDGKIIKTLHAKGCGIERPGAFDEIRLSLKVSQVDKVFLEIESAELLMTDKLVTPAIFKVLSTMKQEEHSTFILSPDCVQELDPNLDFAGFDKSLPLTVDARLMKVNKVEDVYGDRTTFVKTVRMGEGTGQPYFDCHVVLKVSIEIDGVLVFCHKDPLTTSLPDEETKTGSEYFASYDIEDYTIPAVIRKLLKTTKRHQVRSVRCKRKDKLIEHLDDPNGVFTLARFE